MRKIIFRESTRAILCVSYILYHFYVTMCGEILWLASIYFPPYPVALLIIPSPKIKSLLTFRIWIIRKGQEE